METNDPISARLVKLNSQLVSPKPDSNLTREGLLDAFNVLYEECNADYLKKHDQHIAGFVDKHRNAIKSVRSLRVSVSDFEIKSVIGRGHFGEVHLVKEKQTGDVYAMKTIRKTDCLKLSTASLDAERNIMVRSRSVWLTLLQYAFQDAVNLYFVMEYHPGGDLLGLLHRQGGTIPESAATFYIAEVVVALNDLHTMGYVHRDIKPENVLLDRCGHIKIADFGSAAKLNTKGFVADQMPIGTPEYIAPEVLQSHESKNKKTNYGVSCDYWSIGVLAFQLAVGNTPFTGPNTPGTYTKIMNYKVNLRFPPEIVLSQGYVTFVRNLLTDPNSRLNHEQVLKHPMFQNIDFTNLREQVPPYVPKVNSTDDISNFFDIPAKKHQPSIENFKTKIQFSGKQLPFIGFSYTHDSSSDHRCSIPQLQLKNEKVEELEKEVNDLRKQLIINKTNVHEKENLEKKLEDQTRHLQNAETLRNRLEHDLANTLSECSALKRRLELERKDRADLEHKALELIKSAKLKWEVSEKTKVDALNLELSQEMEKVRQLTATNGMLNEQLQHALRQEATHKASLENIQHLKRQSVIGLESCLDRIRTEKQDTIVDLQNKLSDEINSKKALQTKNKSLETKQASLREKLCRAEDNYNELHLKFQVDQQTIKDLESKISVLEEASKIVDVYKEKTFQLEQELMKVQNEHTVRRLQKELSKEKETCGLLQQQMQVLKEEFNAFTIEKETVLKDTINHYTSQIESLRLNLAQTIDEKNSLQLNLQVTKSNEVTNKLKLQTLEDLLKRLESGVTKLETDCDKEYVYKEQIERLEKQLIEVHEKSALEKEELAQLKTKNWRTEKDLNNANIDVRIHKREIKEMEEKNTQMKLQVDQAKATLAQKTASSEAALVELSDINESFADQIMKLKKTVKDLEIKLQLEQTKHTDSIVTIQKFQSTIDVKDDTITKMVKELEALHSEIRGLKHNVKVLEGETLSLTALLESAGRTKDAVGTELQNCKQELRNTQLNLNALREACTLLESQLIEYEKIHASYESKEAASKTNTEKLIAELTQAENEIQTTKQRVNEECSLKLMHISKCKRLTEDIECLQNECTSYKKQCAEYRDCASNLSDELSNAEEKVSTRTVTIQTYERQLLNLAAENNNLKEECSAQLTSLYKMKDSNYYLEKQLADAKKNNIVLHENINELQDVLAQKETIYKERDLKSSGTIQQQTKLIDFLQTKVEESKKKKTISDKLFGLSKKENVTPSTMALSYKDMENLLSKERDVNNKLRAEITKLKSGAVEKDSLLASPKSKLALEQLTMSPTTQSKEHLNQNLVRRMYHYIPHRYDSKLCTKLTKCAHCNNNIPLGRVMKFCTECNVLVHVACTKSLPKTCGVPKALVKHYSKNLSIIAHAESETQEDCTPGDINVEGWVRIPVRNNTGWDKHYACLTSSALKIYTLPPNHSNLSPIEVLELNPIDGYGTVVLEPVPSEIYAPVAKNDLPFVIKVEVHPNTTCWPPKSITIMTLNVEDKKKWSKALLSILQEPETNSSGTIVLKHGDDLDITCLTELDDTKLLGTEQGLYSFSENALLRIAGPISVHQISLLPSLKLAVMIVDSSRSLITCDLDHLTNLTKCAACIKPTLIFKQVSVNNLEGFHLFKASEKHLKLCVATAKQIVLLDYVEQHFIPVRVLDTAEPTSCMLFTEHTLIVGANKFFEIDLLNYEADEFLDVSDSNLRQAILCYNVGSFPLDIMQISSNPVEYLLCFYEFGVFVDEFGRCSRVTDIKWSRLPRALYFAAPNLYIVQFASIEIVHIVSDTCNVMKDSVESLVNVESNKLDVVNPKYLGSSGSGGIYIDSNGEVRLVAQVGSDSDTLSLSTGNEQNQNDCDENFSFTSSIVQGLENSTSDETDSVEVARPIPKKVTFNRRVTDL